MTDFVIRVVVDPTPAVAGAARVDRSLQRIEKTSNRLNSSIRTALNVAFLTAGLAKIIQFADSFTVLQNRVRVVTNGTGELNAVTAELFRVANKARTGVEQVAAVYSRTALATRQLGLTQQETINFTEQLSLAVKLSGAAAQESNAALIQLSQGLSSGVLRGDELRSVLEQLPRVADVIATSMGAVRGELRLLGAQGKITSEVIINAFRNASSELERDFLKTVPTITEAFVVLRNKALLLVGTYNDTSGAGRKLSELILFLANNLEAVADFAIRAGKALAVGFALKGVLAARNAVIALNLAIAANPIGALVIAIGAAIAILVGFGDQIAFSADGVITLQDVMVTLGIILAAAFDSAVASMQKVLGLINVLTKALANSLGLESFSKAFSDAFGDIEFSIAGVIRFAARTVDSFIGLWIGAFDAIVAVWQTLPSAFGKLFINAFNGVQDIIENFVNASIETLNKVGGAVGLDPIDLVNFTDMENTFTTGFSDLGEIAGQALIDGYNSSHFTEGLLDDFEKTARVIAGKRITTNTASAETADLNRRNEAEARTSLAFLEQVRLLEEKGRLLQIGNRERTIEAALLKVIEKLRNQSVVVSADEEAFLRSLIETNYQLGIQAKVLQDIKGPQQDLVDKQAALFSLYGRGAISLAELTHEMQNLVLAQAQLNIESGNGGFADGFIVGIEQMLESVRNFDVEAGQIFADFFEQSSAGFGQAIADSIVFGESISESIGNVARQALASLLGGLIELGIQYVLNQGLSEALTATQLAGVTAVETATIGAQIATTASSVAASTTTTGTIVADNAAIAASAAPAAALESTATFGGAAVAGLAALAVILAFAAGSFADGGHVTGPGTSRSDSIPAMLSNGEFVVNAKSASRFRPLLEKINSPSGFASGGDVSGGSSTPAPQSGSQGGGSNSNIKIINNLDPALMEDFLSSSSGEKVLVNTIERNSSAIKQLLGSV
jgi:tape measure domain-containing protein